MNHFIGMISAEIFYALNWMHIMQSFMALPVTSCATSSILDLQDVYGPNFPGETFRVLKEKDLRQYSKYRTRRLVLEAWDRLFGEK